MKLKTYYPPFTKKPVRSNTMFDLTGTKWDDDWMWSLKRKNYLLWKEIVITEYIEQNDTNLSKDQLMEWFDMDSI